jgi:hypothetical protein
MPRYDARPAGSFRSSLRSDPRYDVREPPDDGDSGPGSDVTESEWGIEARRLRDTANEPTEAPRRRDEEERYDERPVTAKEQYDRRVSRETLPEDEELTGWALTKKCVPATCRTTLAGFSIFSTPNGRSNGDPKMRHSRAPSDARRGDTSAFESPDAFETRPSRFRLGEARVRRGARRGIARDPPVQPRRGANHAYLETTRTRD